MVYWDKKEVDGSYNCDDLGVHFHSDPDEVGLEGGSLGRLHFLRGGGRRVLGGVVVRWHLHEDDSAT